MFIIHRNFFLKVQVTRSSMLFPGSQAKKRVNRLAHRGESAEPAPPRPLGHVQQSG
jgi:hypothetical protein